MDRLQTVSRTLTAAAAVVLIVGTGGVGGCDRGGDRRQSAPTGERVNAVIADDKDEVSVDEFCDVVASADSAKPLAMPVLAGGQGATATSRWRWINVWATWCKPCIEEMPLLRRWHRELAARGLAFDLVFVSADDSEETVAAWRAKHPDTPPSLRIAQVDVLPAWLESMGVGGATIPVQVLVDPAAKVRCVRAAAVKPTDLPAVRTILSGT